MTREEHIRLAYRGFITTASLFLILGNSGSVLLALPLSFAIYFGLLGFEKIVTRKS